MAGLALQVYVISCDGCETIFGAPNGFVSSMDARAAAYGEGWRFPNQITKTGAPGRTTSDVCPECMPTWTPKKQGSRARHLSMDEVRQLRMGEA